MLFFVTSFCLAAGEAPVAEAGLGLYARVGDTVRLNGSGSLDPEGDPLTFSWTQVGGPPVELEGDDTPEPQFTVGDPGTLRFALVVNDGQTDSSPDEVAFVVPYEQVDDVASGCAAVGAPVGLGGIACLLVAARRRR